MLGRGEHALCTAANPRRQRAQSDGVAHKGMRFATGALALLLGVVISGLGAAGAAGAADRAGGRGLLPPLGVQAPAAGGQRSGPVRQRDWMSHGERRLALFPVCDALRGGGREDREQLGADFPLLLC